MEYPTSNFVFDENWKKIIKKSSTIVTREIVHFWKCAGIPTMSDFNINPKIDKIYSN